MNKRDFLRTAAVPPRGPPEREALGQIRGTARRPARSGRGLLGCDPREVPPEARLHQPRERLLQHAVQPVLEAFIAKVREVNYQASHYMRTTQVRTRPPRATSSPRWPAARPRSSCITRNTTESLDTVISGYDWKPGDEAVMAEQDYGHMLAQFKLGPALRHGEQGRAPARRPEVGRRDRPTVRQCHHAAHAPADGMHMVNITGHILPVRKIADMAHARGVDVMVDGAHAFAQFDFRIPDLGCDYYGASLHKWLGCPLGTGILYVRRERSRPLADLR